MLAETYQLAPPIALIFNLFLIFKKKVFFIYDVPSYFNLPNTNTNNKLKIIKIRESKAFLTRFNEYENFQELINNHLDKKMVKEIRRRERKLVSDFNIEYKRYYGHISKEKYSEVMSNFQKLLKSKYEYKNQYFRHISTKNWDFYVSLIYPMVLEKKASLLIIKANNIPVSISLCFHSENIMYGAIPAEDIKFLKYGLSKLRLLKQYEFCFDKKIKIIDLKKGEFGYKKKWCNEEYYFEHHLLYDKSSFTSKLIKNIIIFKYKFKEKFSASKINLFRHKLKYSLKKIHLINR